MDIESLLAQNTHCQSPVCRGTVTEKSEEGGLLGERVKLG